MTKDQCRKLPFLIYSNILDENVDGLIKFVVVVGDNAEGCQGILHDISHLVIWAEKWQTVFDLDKWCCDALWGVKCKRKLCSK